MGNFIPFVLMTRLLCTVQTEAHIEVPKGGDIRLPIWNLTDSSSILVKRTDMKEPLYVYFERDGHGDEDFQDLAYQNRTSRENNYIIIRNAATTDSDWYTTAVIHDEKSEKNRLKTLPTTYRVLVPPGKVQNKDNKNLPLGGFMVVLAVMALVIFF